MFRKATRAPFEWLQHGKGDFVPNGVLFLKSCIEAYAGRNHLLGELHRHTKETKVEEFTKTINAEKNEQLKTVIAACLHLRVQTVTRFYGAAGGTNLYILFYQFISSKDKQFAEDELLVIIGLFQSLIKLYIHTKRRIADVERYFVETKNGRTIFENINNTDELYEIFVVEQENGASNLKTAMEILFSEGVFMNIYI